jgi:hypothetical protein
MSYTTAQLIQILDQELRANWRGERVLLSPAQRIDNPAIAKALDPSRLSKVFAYRDFRAQIHEYQHQHRVSGLVWRTCTFRGRELRFPELHNQLIAIEGDKDILMATKDLVLKFWQDLTQDLTLWQVSDDCAAADGNYRCLTTEALEQLMQRAEWAEVDAAQTELFLGLCWGKPEERHYRWAYPQSGCDRIIAAPNQPSSIKV